MKKIIFILSLLTALYSNYIINGCRIVIDDDETTPDISIGQSFVNKDKTTSSNITSTPTITSSLMSSKTPDAGAIAIAPITSAPVNNGTTTSTVTLTDLAKSSVSIDSQDHFYLEEEQRSKITNFIIHQEALLHLIKMSELFDQVSAKEEAFLKRISEVPELNNLKKSGKLNHDEILFYSCQSGDKSFLNALPIPINQNITKKVTYYGIDDELNPVQLASLNGKTEIVQFLLNSKANIENRSKNSRTALELAAMNGHVDTVKLLQSYIKTINPLPATNSIDISPAKKTGTPTPHPAPTLTPLTSTIALPPQ